MKTRFGDHLLDTERRELTLHGEAVHLSPKAFDLLSCLVERRPRVVPKEELYESVWPDTIVDPANLNNLISEIRTALEDRDRRIIRTSRSFGYSFEAVAEEIVATRSTTRQTFRVSWGGRSVNLQPGRTVIGREDDCDIVIEAPEISRYHAAIEIEGRTATLHDLGSKNGTFVDGKKIEDSVSLADRAEISVGRCSLRFRAFDRKSTTISDPR